MYTERTHQDLQTQTLRPMRKGERVGFVDKRPNLIVQTKLIYSIQNKNPKLSISRDEKNKSFDKSETSVSGVNQMYRDQPVDYNLSTQARVAYNSRFNYFLREGRGYYANLANIIGSRTLYFGTNSHGHSEEQILDANNKKVLGLSRLDLKENAARQGGKITLDIYTELQPCNGNYSYAGPFNCDKLLGLALDESSTVYYSFKRGEKNLESINGEMKKEVAAFLRDTLTNLAYSDYETIKLMRMEIHDDNLGNRELNLLYDAIMQLDDDSLISDYHGIKQIVIERKNSIFKNIRAHYIAIQEKMDVLVE